MNNFKRFDVRELLSRGEDPLSSILARVEALKRNEGLMIVAPFLPHPLIQLLGRDGFQSRHEQRRPAEWVVYFWRDEEPAAGGRAA